MIDEIDLVMWTKNGEKSLYEVLERIEQVVPTDLVHRKILIDDHSIDRTVTIAKGFGWEVYLNSGMGIADGANTALGHVDCEFFVSIEQDVLLVDDWWKKVPKLLQDDNVVVASGVRIPNKPLAVVKLQEYTTERYRRETERNSSFLFGKTLDNTIYRTEMIRKLGGFPKLEVNVGIDTLLAKKIVDSGFVWAVDFDVKSIHLREGLLDELKHYYWYGTCQKTISKALGERGEKLISSLLRTGFSPIRAVQVAYKQKCCPLLYVYPLIRMSLFLGVLNGYITGK